MTGSTHHANMKNESTDRTGVFLVRLWMEENQETGLRARIIRTLDTIVPERSAAVVATVEDICVEVKQWVEDFTDTGSRDGNAEKAAAAGDKS